MQLKSFLIWIGLTGLIVLQACETDVAIIEPNEYLLQIPAGFTYPEIPEDNPLSADKIALGRKLFYDPALSVDSTISCASCHKIENAFADHIAISKGVEGRLGFRNAPTLANIAWVPVMTMDGGNPTLETQPYIPIETHEEMGFNMVLLSERLQADPEYTMAFQDVFNRMPDPFGITRALAAFERTIISGNARYDQYMYQGNVEALTEAEIRGMDIFFSTEVGCVNCHSGFMFTNSAFENNGFFADYSTDSGRARITTLSTDVGKFKVPTLRNIGVTAPYMHNGSVATLQEIIQQYAAGGSGHENQSAFIQPFLLTESQQNDLIAFLLSLTDEQFLTNTNLVE